MALNLVHQHVLEDHLAAVPTGANPNHLSVARRPVIFSVLAHRGHEAAVAAALAAIDGGELRDCGPDEWLLVSKASGASAVETMLADIPGASYVDQSDGRVLLDVRGPSVRQILAKCVAVDLHPDAFGVGRSANMMCCHVAVNLARTGDDTFEIVASRSSCGALFEEMMEMGREYALTASFAGE
jgi:heterotetrameric sarcosine oxidase gamma subunit